MIIYFKGARDIFFLLKGTLTKHFGEQWNLLTGSKEERVKFSREQGNVLPPTLPGRPSHVVVDSTGQHLM